MRGRISEKVYAPEGALRGETFAAAARKQARSKLARAVSAFTICMAASGKNVLHARCFRLSNVRNASREQGSVSTPIDRPVTQDSPDVAHRARSPQAGYPHIRLANAHVLRCCVRRGPFDRPNEQGKRRIPDEASRATLFLKDTAVFIFTLDPWPLPMNLL